MIGILDWGIGGLGFFALLRRRRPRLPAVYLSDAGETPYGKLPAPRLAARLHQLAGFMHGAGVTHLAVACNAASTALPALGVRGIAGVVQTETGPLVVTGVVAHGIRLVRATSARSVGIVGGRRTVRSGIYRRALNGPRRAVLQRVAQPLSARIEAGDLESTGLRTELAAIVRPLVQVEALLLACTHYPAISGAFAAALPGVHLLDPAQAMAEWVEAHWLTHRSHTDGATRFLTTGAVGGMRTSAARAFGVQLDVIERLHPQTLRPRH